MGQQAIYCTAKVTFLVQKGSYNNNAMHVFLQEFACRITTFGNLSLLNEISIDFCLGNLENNVLHVCVCVCAHT